ncbi:MAG: fibrobacter succinogenes major paralogous domain-containing protein, partial [Prevotella sp.]|nr:fibrobacter succinogenes major paralogous domain-containing protein [Prevotella sp.]
KVRQDYKITLKKTTYPINGALTIKDEKTGLEKEFAITSVPVYENTIHKPVLVEGKYWAPVNVGATSTTYSADLAGCGYIFQWGRSYARFINGSEDDLEEGPLSAELASTTYADKFITNTDGNDWLNEPDNTLWSGDNAQGPCPNGWRIPTSAEWTILRDKQHSGTATVDNRRLKIPHDPNQIGDDDLYLPACGHHDKSATSWNPPGTNGRYWSSSPATESRVSRFYFSNTTGNNSTVVSYPRADGYAVRCIQK